MLRKNVVDDFFVVIGAESDEMGIFRPITFMYFSITNQLNDCSNGCLLENFDTKVIVPNVDEEVNLLH